MRLLNYGTRSQLRLNQRRFQGFSSLFPLEREIEKRGVGKKRDPGNEVAAEFDCVNSRTFLSISQD